MRQRVKFIKVCGLRNPGDERNLNPTIAKQLEKDGIVEIIGDAMAVTRKEKASSKTRMVHKVDVKVEKTELIEEKESKPKKPRKKKTDDNGSTSDVQ